MRCPKCAEEKDKVIDSRTIRSGDVIRRRRACLVCGYRYTTYEEVVRANLRVIKRDGRHEELDRGKLQQGIMTACHKRPRIGSRDIEALVDRIAGELENEYEREVPSTVIGKKVMEHLEGLDEVAYVRFASVYLRFRKATEFFTEAEKFMSRE
jgi:transcriptional repressor NrdR